MLNKFFPFLNWIHELKDPSVLRADMVAGLTVALVLIPQSLEWQKLILKMYKLTIAHI